MTDILIRSNFIIEYQLNIIYYPYQSSINVNKVDKFMQTKVEEYDLKAFFKRYLKNLWNQ